MEGYEHLRCQNGISSLANEYQRALQDFKRNPRSWCVAAFLTCFGLVILKQFQVKVK